MSNLDPSRLAMVLILTETRFEHPDKPSDIFEMLKTAAKSAEPLAALTAQLLPDWKFNTERKRFGDYETFRAERFRIEEVLRRRVEGFLMEMRDQLQKDAQEAFLEREKRFQEKASRREFLISPDEEDDAVFPEEIAAVQRRKRMRERSRISRHRARKYGERVEVHFDPDLDLNFSSTED